MNLLYPRIRKEFLLALLKATLTGAAIAGGYGVVHDQITYTLSPEYFTKFKFLQFAWVNLDLPNRLFVGLIGFLATWWVGAGTGWFLGRLMLWKNGGSIDSPKLRRLFLIVFLAAGLAGTAGYFHGSHQTANQWNEWREIFAFEDIHAFGLVGTIHNYGYAGALIGLLIAATIQISQPSR